MSHEGIAGYRVLARIGKGAASDLYAVQDRKTKQVWALKHVTKNSEKDQRFVEQVEQEYSVGSKLDHPNVRKVHRLIKHRKRLRVCAVTLVMELVDGQTLDERRPSSHAQGVRIFHQVALGLSHMHARGFVHADIKPNNILVTDNNQVKIIDLGQGCPKDTVKKRIQGTPGYMAPEQAHRGAITAKTDVYNFGATMYWVFVGEVIPTALPPKADDGAVYTGAVDAAMVKPPVPPHEKVPGLHPLLSRTILDCVKLDPTERPESMAAVAKRLELIAELLDHKETPAPFVITDDETTVD